MTGCNVVMLLNAANNSAAAATQHLALARSHDSCFFNLESFFTPSLFPISYLLNVCFDVLPAFRSVVSMPPKRSSPKGRPNRAKFKCIRCDKVVNGDQRDIHRSCPRCPPNCRRARVPEYQPRSLVETPPAGLGVCWPWLAGLLQHPILFLRQVVLVQ